MRKSFYPMIALLVLVATLLACGGTSSAPSVSMDKYDSSTFTIDYPKEWQKNNMDLFGMTMAFFSSAQLNPEDMEAMDFEKLVSTDPVIIIMVLPAEMATDLGDLDEAMKEMSPTEADKVDIIKEGDTTIGGANGKILIAKGDDDKMGKVGIHIAIAKRDDGSAVVVMGITPEKNMDQNLKIFDDMHKSFKFK